MQEKNNISQTENLSKKLPVMKLIPLTLAGFIAIGGFMGGILLDRLGAGAFPYSMLILTVIVMLLLSNKVLFTAEKK
ncbi:hypothetical protein [Elizabethkingia anophelis]|uniref:hypothetical protein n=1 Tax=Elizabethkingia anophelis TaxID=1117645 RepID=UPI0004E314CB|nr:hypothetical protein [Elizabethkingia anophelis]KFC38233.1 hypothetical protein FF18_15885 [Elizabethkingia anophelis]MDV3500527.1 hypothetical protein [Elizabethkingia anophelis]PKR31018.1 hypothetical protein CWH99_09485 [Elizabethkingia anophelis]PKR35768.1 hypothetical protein CWI00_01100 [Elizabethkingia anophelis]PRQ79806.1 hypothetical protein CMT60_06115 [Elizabethkingia anophelis]